MQIMDKTSRDTVLVILALALLFGLMELVFGARRGDFALEVAALNAGELHRLILAHCLHLSAYHTGLNIAGLCLVTVTLLPVLSPASLLKGIAGSLAAISLGWWVFQSAGITYVGFSGILHGLFAVGALLYLRQGPQLFGWIVLLALVAKLGFEAMIGPVPGADDTIGGRVSTLSHALGALGGALVGRWHWLGKPALLFLAGFALIAALHHEAGFAL